MSNPITGFHQLYIKMHPRGQTQVGIKRYKPVCIKKISFKDIYNTGNTASVL